MNGNPAGFFGGETRESKGEGIQGSLKKHGIEFHEEYVLNRKGKKSYVEETDCLIRQLFAKDDSVDGVITSSNRAAFGARVIGIETAKMIVDEWLGAEFLGGRHQDRIDMLTKIEKTQSL